MKEISDKLYVKITSGKRLPFFVFLRYLQDENERLVREYDLLQRTMEEMESRIEAQQQTLETRDESVRKLLEMVQCKGSVDIAEYSSPFCTKMSRLNS